MVLPYIRYLNHMFTSLGLNNTRNAAVIEEKRNQNHILINSSLTALGVSTPLSVISAEIK